MSKKILFLSPYPINSAPSQRLKYEQYYPYISQAGYQIVTSSFISHRFWEIIYKKGRFGLKVLFTVEGYLRRLIDLIRLRRFDVVYIHLWVTPIGPPVFELLVTLFAKKVIYDIDDLVYLNDHRKQNQIMSFIRGRNKPILLMKRSNHVICCTPRLEEFVRQYNSEVTDISSTINTDLYIPRSKRLDKPLVIGWSGSHSTSRYLHLLDDVFLELAEKMDFTLKVIGDPTFHLEGVNVKAIPWNAETEVEELQEIDIGVYPLPTNEEWVYGKSGLKALQYMALGIPTLATAIGANFRIIEHGVNGFLIRKKNEWSHYFFEIMNDENLYHQIRLQAREKVLKNYSLQATHHKYLDIVHQVIDNS